MGSFNKVILMGNLTRDPEVRFTGNNMAICKFGLAVNRRFKDGQTGEWREEPTFVDITIFGSRGEAFAKYHSKGKPAFIEGTLRLDQWEDKNDGGKRSKLYVVADTWEFVGGGRESGSFDGGDGGGGGGGGARRQAAGYAAQGGGRAEGGEGGGYGSSEPEYLEADDTPF